MDVEPLTSLDEVWLLTQDAQDFSENFREIKHLPCGLPTPRPLNWLFFFLGAFIVLLVNFKKIGVVRAYGVGCLHAALFSRISKVPLIVSYEYEWARQISISKRVLIYHLANLIEKFVLKSSTVTFALTESLAKQAAIRGAREIRVIPNIVDENQILPSSNMESATIPRSLKNSNKKVVLFVGRLHSIKRVEDLIQAVALLRNKFDIGLVIVGDGNERERLVRISNELGLGNSTFFVGFLKRSEVFNYMKLANALVLPSDVEGNPRVLIEAMLCHTPIVATNVDGINNMVRDNWNGLLAEPRDPEGLAKKIAGLLIDDSLAQRLSSTAYDYAKEKYSYQANINKQLEILTKVIKRKLT
jgi:glycosyltransferase involved in cell wall biosynthesis